MTTGYRPQRSERFELSELLEAVDRDFPERAVDTVRTHHMARTFQLRDRAERRFAVDDERPLSTVHRQLDLVTLDSREVEQQRPNGQRRPRGHLRGGPLRRERAERARIQLRPRAFRGCPALPRRSGRPPVKTTKTSLLRIDLLEPRRSTTASHSRVGASAARECRRRPKGGDAARRLRRRATCLPRGQGERGAAPGGGRDSNAVMRSVPPWLEPALVAIAPDLLLQLADDRVDRRSRVSTRPHALEASILRRRSSRRRCDCQESKGSSPRTTRGRPLWTPATACRRPQASTLRTHVSLPRPERSCPSPEVACVLLRDGQRSP